MQRVLPYTLKAGSGRHARRNKGKGNTHDNDMHVKISQKEGTFRSRDVHTLLEVKYDALN